MSNGPVCQKKVKPQPGLTPDWGFLGTLSFLPLQVRDGLSRDRFPYNRMLKKSASGVLASLRRSTYRSVRLFASSLAAALLDGLFEHPVWCAPVLLDVRTIEFPACTIAFPKPAKASG
jgi:hypothetical protein